MLFGVGVPSTQKGERMLQSPERPTQLNKSAIFKIIRLEFIHLLGVGVPTAPKGEIDTDLPLASPTVPCSAKTESLILTVIDS